MRSFGGRGDGGQQKTSYSVLSVGAAAAYLHPSKHLDQKGQLCPRMPYWPNSGGQSSAKSLTHKKKPVMIIVILTTTWNYTVLIN